MRLSHTTLAAILFFSISAFAQQSKFEIKKEEPPPVIEIFPDWPDDAVLIIYSSIPNLQFKSNIGGIRHITGETDKYKIIIETEKQSVTVQKPGYRESSIQVPRLNPKEVVYYSVEELRDTLKAFPINIQSSPRNAKIYIDGELKGTKQTHLVSSGIHKIRLELNGYRFLDTNIVASLNNTLFEFTLEKLMPTQITIKTIPEAATVFIYDKKGNRINKSGQEQTNLQLFLTEGAYTMKISKSGYGEIDTSFSVEQRIKKELVFNLVKEATRLTIVLTPLDANVEIDSKKYSDLKNIELTPGMHLIDITKEGYEPFYEAVEIQRDQQLVKTITLSPIFGSLELTVQPIDAKVKLLKDKKIVSEWTGSNRIDTLATGNYEIEASQRGYKNYSANDIVIEKDKLFSRDIKLSELEFAELNIKRIVPGDDILTNVSLTNEGGKYYISYDLTGDKEDEYNIEVYLLDALANNFEKKLVEVTGDINKAITPGKDKRITWNYTKEISSKISKESLYLKINAGKAGGGIPWYYFAGAAVVGGAVYFVVQKKDESTATVNPPGGTSTIPDQPGRP